MTREHALAEDVTQGVFMALAQKAAAVARHPAVTGWLFQAVRYGAAAAARRERVRRRHEARAMTKEAADDGWEAADWDRVAGALEEAVARLRATDREAILLRFYRQLNWAEVGAALGVTEDAARMRVARATERLRGRLTASGCDVGAGASGVGSLTAALSAHLAVAAPAHVAHVAVGGGVAGGSAVGEGVAAVSKGVLTMTAVKAQLATAGLMAAALAVGGVALIAVVATGGSPRPPAPAGTLAAVTTAAAAPQLVPAGPETTVISGPLRPDGTVDYVAALNARYGAGVTPENNGYVQWLKAVGTGPGSLDPAVREKVLAMAGATGVPAGEVLIPFNTYMQARGRQMRQGTGRYFARLTRGAWREEDYPDGAEYLRAQDAALDAVAAAVQRPRWWVPAVASDGRGVWTVHLLQSLAPYQAANQALLARATRRLGARNFDGFRADVRAAKLLARRMGAIPANDAQIFANVYDGNASATIAAVAASGVLTEAQCRTLAADADGLPPVADLRDGYAVLERWYVLDLFAAGKYEVWEDEAGEVAHLNLPSPESLVEGHSYSPVVRVRKEGDVDWAAAMRGANAVFDEALKGFDSGSIAEAKQFDAQHYQAMEQAWAMQRSRGGLAPAPGEGRTAFSERFGRLMGSERAPSGTAFTSYREDAMKGVMARMLLGVAGVKARTGRWPRSLAEVPAAELGARPALFAREQVGYEVTDAGPRLFLMEPDGKEVPARRGSVGAEEGAGPALP